MSGCPESWPCNAALMERLSRSHFSASATSRCASRAAPRPHHFLVRWRDDPPPLERDTRTRNPVFDARPARRSTPSSGRQPVPREMQIMCDSSAMVRREPAGEREYGIPGPSISLQGRGSSRQRTRKWWASCRSWLAHREVAEAENDFGTPFHERALQGQLSGHPLIVGVQKRHQGASRQLNGPISCDPAPPVREPVVPDPSAVECLNCLPGPHRSSRRRDEDLVIRTNLIHDGLERPQHPLPGGCRLE